MTRTKPNLHSGSGGLVDAEFIPAEVRNNLMLALIRSPLTEEQKESLLDYANDISQMVASQQVESGKTQREQIEAVATNARRLLASIKALSEPARKALKAHSDALTYSTAPKVEIGYEVKSNILRSGEPLIASVWDWVSTLETVADYTSESFKIDKTSKPKQQQGRGFVTMIADFVRELTGVLPPKDPASWFAEFADRLGKHLGFEAGSRIIASGIEALR